MTAHTEGPWRMRIDSGTVVQAGDVDLACTLDGHGRIDHKTQHANRMLLAAAPTMEGVLNRHLFAAQTGRFDVAGFQRDAIAALKLAGVF